MNAVVDSSSLISLAWAGLLGLLERSPLRAVVPREVRHETVAEGLARGYPDAAAIESVVARMPTTGSGRAEDVDEAVLRLARVNGTLLTNDVALGRRASSLGVRWLRTADVVLLCVRQRRLDREGGLAALTALHRSGRITDELLHAYSRELS